VSIFPVGHIEFHLKRTDDAPTFAVTPEGDAPKKKLFSGFQSQEMAQQLRTLADAIEAEVAQ
jgi:hypothetical protein